MVFIEHCIFYNLHLKKRCKVLLLTGQVLDTVEDKVVEESAQHSEQHLGEGQHSRLKLHKYVGTAISDD